MIASDLENLKGSNVSNVEDAYIQSKTPDPFEFSSGVVASGATPIFLHTSEVAPDAVTGDGGLDVNPYKVDFNLPDNLSTGNYQLEVYNGHGDVYGVSNPVPITVASAPTSVNFSFAAAISYSASPGVSEYRTDGSINPAAVNAAISGAYSYVASGTYGSFTYADVQLPPGLIEITDSSDIIQLEAYVHLVGAGDTGNAATGTVIEGDTTGGATVQSLVKVDSGSEFGPLNTGISDMSMLARGMVSDGVIFADAYVFGLTVNDITIDATDDNPAFPDPVEDIDFGNLSSNLQILNSTFIGQGLGINATASTVDNCDFIACGAAGAQISESAPSSDLSAFSVTRTTDGPLVNNITSPGGDVEYDAGTRLFADYDVRADLYVGDNTASDMYNVPQLPSGANGGEIISIEPDVDYDTSRNIAVYQNTLSGDGAESYLSNSSGVSTQGENTVVDDNDISRVASGIQFYDPSGPIDTGAFALVSDNSVYQVHNGVVLVLFEASVTPQIYCCSFSDNLINGIGYGPTLTGNPQPAAIAVAAYFDEGTAPPQYLTNIFNGNIITGVSLGFAVYDPYNILLGDTVLSNTCFSSDGSYGSYEIGTPNGIGYSPIVIFDNTWEGFWTS